jgi:very-short-patch-repair endonuclease
VDTPFQDVATVRAWQLCVTQTLGWALPSGRSVADRLAAASPETLRALASLVPDAASERSALQSALAKLQNTLAAARGGMPPSPELPVAHALPMLDTLLGEIRAAVSALHGLGFAPSCPVPQLSPGLDGLVALLQHRRSLEDNKEARAILGPVFQGAFTPAASLRQLVQLARALSQSHLPETLREWLRHADFPMRVQVLLDRTQRILGAIRQLDAAHAHLDSQVQLDRRVWYRQGPCWGAGGSAEVVARRAQEALDHVDELPAWRGMLRARAALDRQGLAGLVGLVESGVVAPASLWQGCEFLVYDRLAARGLEDHPALSAFDGIAHEQLQQRFRRYDVDTIEAFRKRAAHLVDQRPVPEGVRTGPVAAHSDLALLEHECRKQRRQIPIRQLVRRASGALQALAPCFMMGPRAVAQYLEPGALTFDILVMDEASQLRPEDAIGAICRARQVAIIGDPLQLPPTSFFDRMSDPEEIDEEQATTFDDAESILDVASSIYSPIRRLRWHYRSRHESLIAFSNESFYDGSLVVFPSPRAAGPDLGLRFELVEGAVYQAGLNEMEARRVVDRILDHLRMAPERSLGVVAMNFKQRDLIEELLHARLKDEEAIRAKLDEINAGVEPLFVKNLENVQGDERDVIFVSVTYGKGTDGRLLQRFGPINGAAGPRRLNVLFTRAKRQVVVFASFEPEELVLGEGASAGAKVLAKYLTHARDRTVRPRDWSDRSAITDCERTLAGALEHRGFEVVPRVGVAGAFLDVAVRTPGTQEFVLGIQIDGPDYRRSFSARDRDRLRPSALTNLGWRVLSVWSLDWSRDPSGTLQRILDALAPMNSEAGGS